MMKPPLIETAPRDGTEIYLISVQPHDGGGRIISIMNGHWDGNGFMIGDVDAKTNIGDACATHWAPIDIFEFGPIKDIAEARDRAHQWRNETAENEPESDQAFFDRCDRAARRIGRLAEQLNQAIRDASDLGLKTTMAKKMNGNLEEPDFHVAFDPKD